MVRIKEYRTLPAAGIGRTQKRQSRVIEVEKAEKGAEVTEEPVRDWQDDGTAAEEVDNGR